MGWACDDFLVDAVPFDRHGTLVAAQDRLWVAEGRGAVADARSPGLPPASFDVVASSLVLFFLQEPVDALRAWTALLVPGGRLGIATFGPFGVPPRRDRQALLAVPAVGGARRPDLGSAGSVHLRPRC